MLTELVRNIGSLVILAGMPINPHDMICNLQVDPSL